MNQRSIKVAVVGLGYFSQFHLRAWQRIEDVSLVGITDTDAERMAVAAPQNGTTGFATLKELLAATDPDIVDIVTPPETHAQLIRAALRSGRTIICQKPFCRDLTEASAIVREAEATGSIVLVHENFRFQPWYRVLKSWLDEGRLGEVYQCRFALRPGDGRGPAAYLDRQPNFQFMPRLLVHETGVHFLDLFCWLFGEVSEIYADLRRLNGVIAGEDAGTMILTHQSGVRSVFDGNRLADHIAENRRKTMGEMVVEAEAGTMRLDGEGRLFFRAFGENGETEVPFEYEDRDFGGGCVEVLNRHVVDHLRLGTPLENLARDYLAIVRLDEMAYRSTEAGRKIVLAEEDHAQ